MTEIEERRRKQAIKVAITEGFMLLVIIVLVSVLVMLSLGYNFNFGSGVETSGLVHINSIPTGAAIAVDGEGMLFPTNQSKTMTSGEHEITLERDGYTSWSKKITVTEGMLYRLYYPRLYKEEREVKKVIAATEDKELLQASVSSDRKHILLIYADGWQMVNLNDGEPKAKKIDVSEILENPAVDVMEWAENSSRVLVRATNDTGVNWILVNLNEPAKSLDLTAAFKLEFSEVRLANNSADRLLVLAEGQLREINVSDVEISKVLAEDVASFSDHGGEVVYVSKGKIYYYVGADAKPVLLYESEDAEANLLALVSKYYGDSYLTIAQGAEMLVYYGKLPNPGEKFKNTMKLAAKAELEMVPLELYSKGAGELMVAMNAQGMAVMDAENYVITSYEAESPVRWLSDFDIYTLRDNWLTAWDFDNTNPHALVSDIAEEMPAAISENNRYLYYFDSELNLNQVTIR